MTMQATRFVPSRRACLTALLSVAWLGAAAAAAEPTFDVDALQRLLRAGPPPEVRFTESRESPWLSAPATSHGTMVVRPGWLEKRVEAPRAEVYRLLPDRVQMETAGHDGTPVMKELSFGDAPAIAALAESLRLVMAGDLAALRSRFDLTVSGEPSLWSMRLAPRSTAVSRALQQIDMQGSWGRLLVIVTQEARGERTTTRLLEP